MGEAGLPVHEVASSLVDQPPGVWGTVMNPRVSALSFLTPVFGPLFWLIPRDLLAKRRANTPAKSSMKSSPMDPVILRRWLSTSSTITNTFVIK